MVALGSDGSSLSLSTFLRYMTASSKDGEKFLQVPFSPPHAVEKG